MPEAASTPGSRQHRADHRLEVIGDQDSLGSPLADPGTRLGAYLLDQVIGGLGFYLIVLIFALPGFAVAVAGVEQPPGWVFVFLGLGFLAGIAFGIVYGFMAPGRTGQTYGKHLLNIRIVNVENGRPIGSGWVLLRSIVQALGMYALFLGVLWILWDDQRQGWHDKAVNSVVVEVGRREHLNPVAFIRHVLSMRRP